MSDYWKRRALEQQKAQHKRIDDMTEELAEYWERAIRDVENDILAWYARFAREQGVTLQEAHRLLDTRDMKALRMSLKEFEQKARENKDGRWEKELAAASARVHISRLEQLELSIRNKLYELYHETEDVTAQALRDTYTNETYHNEYLRQQAEGKYSTFSEIPNDAVDKVLSKPWTADGHNWSDRLWQNREALAGKLQGELVRMLVRGDTPVDAGKRLAKQMGVGLYQATRLVQTECTYAQTLADMETADKLGADKMEYVATLEMHTCGTCGELDGSVIERKYLEPGVNAPPMHPHCRCTLVPYYEDNDTARWARDPETGKGKPVSDISFDEWKRQYLTKDLSKNVELIDFSDPDFKLSGIDEEKAKVINRGIQTIANDYDLPNYEIRTVSLPDKPNTPFQVRPVQVGNWCNLELVINKSFNGWGTGLERLNARIYNNYRNGILAAQNLEQLVWHEMAHLLTYKNAEQYAEFMAIEEKLHEIHIKTLTEYAKDDGSEAIAEAFVKEKNGESIPPEAQNLLEQYVRIHRKREKL